MKELSHYTVLAEIFRYPYAGLYSLTDGWMSVLRSKSPVHAYKLEPFIDHLRTKPLSFQQEYYVSTFEVQAVCFLDVGYILFGNNYKRGVFLVNMKHEQDKVKNDCGNELADHLPNVLTLLPKLTDPDFAEEMVYSLLIPAVREMIKEFRDMGNIYRGLLEVLLSVMESDYPASSYEQFSFDRSPRTSFSESSD
jgi:nitrate reductase assembly molybdenum cofactor insertion protein NarJ